MSDRMSDTRTINAACLAAAMGRAPAVYADVEGEKQRIVAARRKGGVLQVKVLSGEARVWYPAESAYAD
jgi:hypothetical protein